jgi:hypothetical protein
MVVADFPAAAQAARLVPGSPQRTTEHIGDGVGRETDAHPLIIFCELLVMTLIAIASGRPTVACSVFTFLP